MELKRFFKFNCLVAILLLGMGMTSCGNNNGELTKGDVEDEIERICAPAFKFFQTTEFETGFYELNSEDERYVLRELEAAGMITYSAERYIEKVTKTRDVRVVTGYYYSWWTGSREPEYSYIKKNYTEDVEHIFVKVALTEEGQRYVVADEDLNNIKEDIKKLKTDKDLVCPNAETEYPEDSIRAEVIKTILDEGMSEDTTSDGEDAVDSDSVVADSVATDNAGGDSANKKLTAYERALKNVQTTTVSVTLYKLDISKVRKIKCTTEMLESGYATAEVIFEYVDVTPFGRILKDKRDGEKFTENFEFTLYTDGWVIKE